MKPPVRELLSSFLRKRQDTILRRLLTLVEKSPELLDTHAMLQTDEYRHVIETLLDLLAQNIANPADRRCFSYARQRAVARFRENFHAAQLLRIAALHRQIVIKMVSRNFSEDPSELRRMTEIIEEQINELELELTSAYQNARDRQWHISETKYFSLFENASEAILSFRPGEGQIIEANMQAERLLGRARGDILRLKFTELFPGEHQEQAQWLMSQTGGSANIRLEDMTVRRADGLLIPISLSCNWVHVEGAAVAQAIMRDVTQLRQMQRELQSYAEQLEERVASRTKELQVSEDRYRTLFLQEQQRAQHLSLINSVQQCALSTRDLDEFLHQVTVAIQSHFRHCDVVFYLCRDEKDPNDLASMARIIRPDYISHSEYSNQSDCPELVVTAQMGGHGLSLPVGATHPGDIGLPGHVIHTGQMLAIANDAPEDARYVRPAGVHRDAGAEMCVPVRMEDDRIGVISVLSQERGAFDPRDAVALQTAATIAAAHVQSSRMFRQMSELKEFNETLVDTMLHSLMVVNREGTIQLVNDRLCQTLGVPRPRLIGRPVTDVFNDCVITDSTVGSIDAALQNVTESGAPRELPEVHMWVRGEGGRPTEFVVDLRLSRVYFRGEAQIVVLMINLTQRWRKTQQMQLVNEMGRMFQTSLDVNRVLHTVLTCITAGPALGFNRAFLLLLHEDSDTLRGAMALGPSSPDEASLIWREMNRRNPSLQEILADASGFDPAHPTALQTRTINLQINLQNSCFEPLRRAVHERQTLRLTHSELAEMCARELSEQSRIAKECEAMLSLFSASEIAVAPLASKDRTVGIVLADNLYSGAPIEEDDLQLLETVAQQAALTVDNALTYGALQKAQRELVSAERLVAVGEMAARVSHEIRNPLATVGGFARQILKRPEDDAGVQRKAGVIVEEVSRLEELLSDLLDMTRPRQFDLQPHAVNDIVERALLLAESDIKAFNVEIAKDLAPDLPLLMVDGRRLLQALLNTIRNGAQAMPKGGMLAVTTRVSRTEGSIVRLEIEIRDSGVGIPAKALSQVFDPFFSTKIRGSGLGLAVTLAIIRDLGGDIDVFSDEGQGTTFIMHLPLQRAPQEPPTPYPPNAQDESTHEDTSTHNISDEHPEQEHADTAS